MRVSLAGGALAEVADHDQAVLGALESVRRSGRWKKRAKKIVMKCMDYGSRVVAKVVRRRKARLGMRSNLQRIKRKERPSREYYRHQVKSRKTEKRDNGDPGQRS